MLNDLLGGIDPYRVESSGLTPLAERLLSLLVEGAAPQPLTRLLQPNGAGEIPHFINSAVLPPEEATAAAPSAKSRYLFGLQTFDDRSTHA